MVQSQSRSSTRIDQDLRLCLAVGLSHYLFSQEAPPASSDPGMGGALVLPSHLS